MRPERPIAVPTDLDERLARLAEALAGEDELQAVVLFGSLARGSAHSWSDGDVGVLSEQPLDYALQSRLLERAEAALGRPVDVVDLRRVGLPLRGRAVRHARPIAVFDEAAWIEFVRVTTLDWLDYKPAYERAVRIAVERLAEPRR